MASQVEEIKRVPGAPWLLVDGFRFQSPACRAYFLTHAHSDHTAGLTPRFNAGPIYCSPITLAILRWDMGIRQDLLRPLPLDEPTVVCGVEVIPIDANHCPGAVMFLFTVPAQPGSGKQEPTRVLHTGDMRWQAGMERHPALTGRQLDVLMLDTTYCRPRWAFPPQKHAVELMAEAMAREAHAGPPGAVLFAVGSYHIGKERAFLGAAAALGWRVFCDPAKRRLLRLLGLPPEWLALLTEDAEAAQIHVLGMGEQLHPQALAERIAGSRWQRVVALRPTGWSWRPRGGLDVRREGVATVIGVPYSEHSSFEELRDCVRALRPRRLVPTVGGGDAAQRRAIVDRFAPLMELSGDRSRLPAYFSRQPRGDAEQQRQPTPDSGPASQGEAAACEGASADAVSCAPAGENSAAEAAEAQNTPPPARQAQRGSGGEAEAGDTDVDLASVDVAEQRRILAAIEASRGSSGGSRKRAVGAGSGGLRQAPLRRFLASPPQLPPP